MCCQWGHVLLLEKVNKPGTVPDGECINSKTFPHCRLKRTNQLQDIRTRCCASCRLQYHENANCTVVSVTLQTHFVNTMLDIAETDPSVPLVVTPTVPISCPPCSVTVSLSSLRGLTVSSCSVTFYTTEPPLSSQTMYLRAVPTAGRNSRLTQLQFLPVSAKVSGTGWDGYSIRNIPVSTYIRMSKLFR